MAVAAREVQITHSFGATQRAGWWLLCLIAIVAYGSLLPFEFDASRLYGVSASWPYGLTFMKGGLADALTNVALFVPLGFLFLLAQTEPRTKSLWRLCVAAILSGVFSFLLEWGQTWTIGRVGSWNDVRCNVVGGMLGAAAAMVMTGLRHSLLGGWPQRLAAWREGSAVLALMLGLLFFHLLPFDVVRNTAGLHQSFVRAEWSLVDVRAATPGAPPLSNMVHQLLTASWFSLLGFLLWRAERKSATCKLEAGLRIVIQGTGLIVVVEFLQLFSRVHVFDVASILLRILALWLGVWFCSTVRNWPHMTASAVYRLLGAVGAMLLVGLAILGEWQGWPAWGEMAAIQIVDWPMESIWRLPTNYAVLEVAEACAMYAPMTAFVWIGCRGKREGNRNSTSHGADQNFTTSGCFMPAMGRFAVLAAVVIAASIIEVLHATTNGTTVFDFSEPAMAAGVSIMTLNMLPLVFGLNASDSDVLRPELETASAPPRLATAAGS